MKTCSKCGVEKFAEDFYPKMGRCKVCHNLAARAWAVAHPERVTQIRRKFLDNPVNKEKGNIAAKRWNAANPERVKETRFEYNLKKLYGLSVLEYNQMLARQDFRCAICGDDESAFHVDHNHKTNKVRGLLCGNCNTGIGLLKDSRVVIEDAARYVSQ